MANTKPARYKPRRNTPKDRNRQRKRKLRQSNIADGGLTPKVRMVIENYLTNGFIQRKAMLDAGYAETTAKWQQYGIFGRPDVKAEIAKRIKTMTDAAEVDGDWLMRRLKLLIDSNIGDILRKLIDHDYDLQCLSDDELFVLGDIQITTTEVIAGKDEDGNPIFGKETKVKLKGEGKNQTIVTALRKLGLFKDSVEVRGDADVIAALQAGRKRASGQQEG